MKGLFITFEGPEKSGKSTQSRLLKQYLTKKGFSCLSIREPGSSLVGEKVRKILLNKNHTSIAHSTEMLLYMSARAQLIEEVIEPALKQSKIVICDRFLDSTIAYQGYGLGMDITSIKRIGKFATKGINPDITFLLDLGNGESLFKDSHKKDRIELRPENYHKRVRRGYLLLSKLYPKRIKVVCVKDSIISTQKEIRKIIDILLRIYK